jgi:tetratricopeptide (TPR) repeat protein
MAAYRRAFALDPNRPMALMSLSAMYLREGRLEDARRLVDSAVAASRTVTSPYVRAARGSIALQGGDLRTAHDEADLALAMDTTFSVPARSLLARVYAAEGNREKAAAEVVRLLRDIGGGDLSPTNARYAASALLPLGRTQEAIRVLERARPRGAVLWFYLRSPEFQPLMADPRFLRLYKEADPR